MLCGPTCFALYVTRLADLLRQEQLHLQHLTTDSNSYYLAAFVVPVKDAHSLSTAVSILPAADQLL